jgi:hypothetical protein
MMELTLQILHSSLVILPYNFLHFMNRLFLTFSLCILFAACSKMDDKPAQTNDSLLSKKMDADPVPEAQPKKDTATGLLIDQSRFRTPEHEAMLQRFEPLEIARIYHAFKEIRKPGISEDQINKFTKEKKISVDELKAILEEGDRLGWAKN